MKDGTDDARIAKALALILRARQKFAEGAQLLDESHEVIVTGTTSALGMLENLIRQVEKKTGETFRRRMAGDIKEFRRLLQDHTPSEIQVRIQRFVDTENEYYRRRNYAVDVFVKDFSAFSDRNPTDADPIARSVVASRADLRRRGLFDDS